MIDERHLRCGGPAAFQGDERDVMFLSLVMAPNVRHRALTGLADQRRFNVAMSRARDQVWLFHSMKQHDLGPTDLRRRLVGFFENPGGEVEQQWLDREQLERAARLPRQRGSQPDPYDSWLEVDVARELLRRRFRVLPQVAVAGYRIDLVVEGAAARLAVECDGDAWHGPERYESDLARQRQLEHAGLRFVRVRESDFYLDREAATETIVAACTERGIRPLDEARDRHAGGPTEEPEASGDERPTARAKATGSQIEQPETDPLPRPPANQHAAEAPFCGYGDERRFPDPRKNPSPADIAAVVGEVIAQDGPLTRSSVYRLYVRGCPEVTRATPAIRQPLDRALDGLLRAGAVVAQDELQDGSPEGQVLRRAGAARVRIREAGDRDLLEIPPSDVAGDPPALGAA